MHYIDILWKFLNGLSLELVNHKLNKSLKKTNESDVQWYLWWLHRLQNVWIHRKTKFRTSRGQFSFSLNYKIYPLYITGYVVVKAVSSITSNELI